MSAELLLAIPPTIDLCLKYIKEGKKLCSTLKHADVEISERVLRLDNSWLRFIYQLNFLQRVQHMMEDDHREVYEQTLFVFQSKLEIVISKLKSLVNPQPREYGPISSTSYSPKRAKYAIRKDGLDKAIDELELWQRTADQSWFLLMRIADPRVDNALTPHGGDSKGSNAASIPSTTAIRAGLRQDDGANGNSSTGSGITLEPKALSQMDISAVPFSDGVMAAKRTFSNGQTTMYILNRIQCQPPSKYQSIKRNTRDLVRKLQHDEPQTFGLLNCKGFITESKPSGPSMDVAFTMVFRSPPDLHNPKTLRDLLLNTQSPTSLSTRLQIARDLAKSVGYVHTFGFVHKNVRPESILIFELANGKGKSAFLTGFENFRRDEGWTQRRGDDALDRNLYRHASRQGASPREDYEMQHDIYSLGVCLLEIGLWASFVEYNPDGTRTQSGSLQVPSDIEASQLSSFLLEEGKEHLLYLARNHLPGNMGDKYAEVVETCLTCLDEDNVDFGDEREFEDEHGIRVGARYIEKVVLRLNMLSM